MLFGTGEGEMGPWWAIIKCSVQGIDLTTARVLNALHAETGFTVGEGWELLVWEQELTLPVKGKKGQTETKMHRRPYLIHKETLRVVTVQIKAWMDTPGIIMWNELQLSPWALRRTGRSLLVWDNCGSHKTKAVQDSLARTNTHQEELPPNMTDDLQV